MVADSDQTSQETTTPIQSQTPSVVPMPNPQNITTAPILNLANEFKGGEPPMPQPSNINTPPTLNMANEIKKSFQMIEEK